MLKGNCASPDNWRAFGPFVLFAERKILKKDGKPIDTGEKALELLTVLTEEPGLTLSKMALLDRMWPHRKVDETNLRVAVSALRRILGRTCHGEEYILNAVGRGYFFNSAIPIEYSSRTSNIPGLIRDARLAGCVPSLLKPVFGRQAEISRAVELLGQHRLVTIVGEGGIGKSTVAISVASQIDGAIPVVFVDFGPVQDPTLIEARLASALGGAPETDDLSHYILDRLAAERQLIIFDNCEQIADGIASVADRYLRATSLTRIIATSREPLRVKGEIVLRLDGLAYPGCIKGLDSKSVQRFPAIQLFVERAQASQANFILTEEMLPHVAEICRRLGGVALAIQLAANRIPAYGVKGVLAALDARFTLLTSGLRTSVPRHRTLAAAISHSVDLLNDTERDVFLRLSVFNGTFSLEAAIKVASCSEYLGAMFPAILGRLVDKSLVIFCGDRGGPTYRLTESIRAFGFDRLRTGKCGHEVIFRHAKHVIAQYQTLAENSPCDMTTEAGALARQALDELRTAIERLLNNGDNNRAVELFCANPVQLTSRSSSADLDGRLKRSLGIERRQ